MRDEWLKLKNTAKFLLDDGEKEKKEEKFLYLNSLHAYAENVKEKV